MPKGSRPKPGEANTRLKNFMTYDADKLKQRLKEIEETNWDYHSLDYGKPKKKKVK